MDLNIRVVENGFIVCESPGRMGGTDKQWAFETAKGLSDFILEWAEKPKPVKGGGMASV